MFNDELNDDNIKKELERIEKRLEDLKILQEKIKSIKFYECGIRKLDHKVCYFFFTLSGVEGLVDVRIPQSSESYRINLDTFVMDYIPYSAKTRALLPKRYKR
jgi:hypothetical protein